MDPSSCTMEWQTSASLPLGYDPDRHDYQEYHDVGGACHYGSLSHSQTPSYPSEVRLNSYSLYLNPRVLTIIKVSDGTSSTSSPLDPSSLCPSRITPPDRPRNMFPCLGFDYNVNRHLIYLETSEPCQTSEILPIECQDPKAPQAVNALSLMNMKSLISTETSLSEQTNSSNDKKSRRCTQCQIRRKKVTNSTSELLGPRVNLGS